MEFSSVRYSSRPTISVGNSKKKVKFDTNVNANRKAYTKDELDVPSKAVNKTKSYAEAVNSQNKIMMRNRNKAYRFNEGGALIKSLKQSSFN